MSPPPGPLRVLIVEDSEDDAELLLIELRRAGYKPIYRLVQTREDMAAALDEQEWDVVVSDYNMPHFSAIGALGLMHERHLDRPFIILSGAIGEETAVAAMKAGAHDYVMKDNLARLIPAIERELREVEVRTARHQAERALADSEARYRTMVDTANDAIVALDEACRISYVNKRAPEMLGSSAAELLGQPFISLLDPGEHAEWQRRLAQLERGDRLLYDARMQRPDGQELWVLNSCSPQIGPDGEFQGAIAMLKDVTERKQAEEALAHQALHDSLTGLPNRNLLHDRLDQAILTARRERRPLAVLLIDLDRFKEVNDTFGHHYGDMLLKQVGPRLRGALRESDTVARLGGDEFAVLLPSCATVDAAMLTATKLLAALEAPFVVEGQTLSISGSMGIVMYPEHGEDVQTVMRRADVAMYAAKRDGEGFSVYSSEQDRHSAVRLTLSSQLRQAIDGGELVMHYQPKISLRTRQVIDVEALVRWRHRDQGLLGADHFVPLAEQTGLIKPLTQWVLRTVLDQYRLWRERGLDMGVAVNISMRNLHDPMLPDAISELLEFSNVPPSALRLEITETALMTNPVRAMEVVTRLSELGIHLSIDDFGTGYSSLAYLKRLPVREIKIDKSFVRDMAEDENDAVIVRSTIDLGHNLGLQVVAEGVESRAAWDQLVDLGCDLAQGFLMAAPMTAAELECWLAQTPPTWADAPKTRARKGQLARTV
ncbi:MAG TPA: EAL domain-containing protein [Chloroflexota bacterium]|nr:EAL domain-containing protein [Chloroflexota bacterium]